MLFVGKFPFCPSAESPEDSVLVYSGPEPVGECDIRFVVGVCEEGASLLLGGCEYVD